MSSAASPADALPAEWVDRIFRKLSIRYGRQFLARWDGLPMTEVQADWAEQLAGFIRRPDCIAYALEHLPTDKPPTAAQFRELCNSMPAELEVFKDLPMAKTPIPARVLAMLDRLKEPSEVDAQYAGPKGWAYRLRDKEAKGLKLSSVQRRFWREALGVEA